MCECREGENIKWITLCVCASLFTLNNYHSSVLWSGTAHLQFKLFHRGWSLEYNPLSKWECTNFSRLALIPDRSPFLFCLCFILLSSIFFYRSIPVGVFIAGIKLFFVYLIHVFAFSWVYVWKYFINNWRHRLR